MIKIKSIKYSIFIILLFLILFSFNSSFASGKYPFDVYGCDNPQYLTNIVSDGQGSSYDVDIFECPRVSLGTKVEIGSSILDYLLQGGEMYVVFGILDNLGDPQYFIGTRNYNITDVRVHGKDSSGIIRDVSWDLNNLIVSERSYYLFFDITPGITYDFEGINRLNGYSFINGLAGLTLSTSAREIFNGRLFMTLKQVVKLMQSGDITVENNHMLFNKYDLDIRKLQDVNFEGQTYQTGEEINKTLFVKDGCLRLSGELYVNNGKIVRVSNGSEVNYAPDNLTSNQSECTSNDDAVKPVITLIGDSTVTVTVGDNYTDPGATAYDDRDGDISNLIVVNNPVDTSTAGTYVVTYNVSDRAGNQADEMQRQVIVISDRNKKIFLIGDSTMRYDYDGNRDVDGPLHRTGWGSKLSTWMFHPNNVFNRARRAAIAGGIEDNVNSYRRDAEIDPWIRDNKGPYDWNSTRELIENEDTSNGGFLLIQFGANDKHQGIAENDFKSHLIFYIDWARSNGITPILVTPINPRSTLTDLRTPYTDYIEDVATSEGVAVIDLHQRSLDIYSHYTAEQRYGLFGSWHLDGVTRDTTHLDRQGATIVSEWVKDIACEQNATQELCDQFDQNISLLFAYAGEDTEIVSGESITLNGAGLDTNGTIESYLWQEGNSTLSSSQTLNFSSNIEGPHLITLTVTDNEGNTASDNITINVINRVVLEDAEDGNTDGWLVYDNDPAGASISNEEDPDKNSRVIVLSTDNGIENGFKFDNLNITDNFWLSWDMKTNEDFRIFIKVRTSNYDPLYIEYAPVDNNEGYVEVNGKHYVRVGIGSDVDDDVWTHISRDTQADFKTAFPDETVEEIYGIFIRGNVRIDDIVSASQDY